MCESETCFRGLVSSGRLIHVIFLQVQFTCTLYQGCQWGLHVNTCYVYSWSVHLMGPSCYRLSQVIVDIHVVHQKANKFSQIWRSRLHISRMLLRALCVAILEHIYIYIIITDIWQSPGGQVIKVALSRGLLKVQFVSLIN